MVVILHDVDGRTTTECEAEDVMTAVSALTKNLWTCLHEDPSRILSVAGSILCGINVSSRTS
jgi:hypothetical protein